MKVKAKREPWSTEYEVLSEIIPYCTFIMFMRRAGSSYDSSGLTKPSENHSIPGRNGHYESRTKCNHPAVESEWGYLANSLSGSNAT